MIRRDEAVKALRAAAAARTDDLLERALDALLAELEQAEAKLAKADGLVKALRKIDQPGRPEPERGIARATLAAWETE